MNNAKRRRDKTTGALNRDTCKPPRRKRKKKAEEVWGGRGGRVMGRAMSKEEAGAGGQLLLCLL